MYLWTIVFSKMTKSRNEKNDVNLNTNTCLFHLIVEKPNTMIPRWYSLLIGGSELP